MARVFPGSVFPTTYEEFVGLYLNVKWASIKNSVEQSEAVEIGTGGATTPDDWINAVEDDPEARAKWRIREMKREGW